MSNSVLCLTIAGVALGLALVAKLSICRLDPALGVIRRGPKCAVGAEVPGVASALSLSVHHRLNPPYGVSREICKICYRANRVGFHVPDAVWGRVVPPHLVDHVVCLDCFTSLADEKLIDWSKDIEFSPVSLVSHLEGID